MSLRRYLLLVSLFAPGLSDDAAAAAPTFPTSQAKSAAPAQAAAAAASTEPLRIEVGPVLQAPSSSEMTVTWITNRLTTSSVEYGPVGGELTTAQASRHGLIAGNERVHKIVLRGLRPGTTYRYRVVSKEILDFKHWRVTFGETTASEFHTFRTTAAQPDKFAFLVFNDVHDQAGTFGELLQTVRPKAFDLVVLNGDIVSYLDHEGQIVPILKALVAQFAREVPLLWVRGNHETRGRFARSFPDYIAMPEERYYHAFTQGPVHFLVLDTGEDKIDAHREYSGLVDFFRYREEQGQWLKRAVQSDAFRRAKYRVVIAHMPFPDSSSNNPDGHGEKGVFLGSTDAYKHFGTTLEEAGVDVMFSGHRHRAAIIEAEPGRHSYPIIQGGGNKGEGRTLIQAEATAEALTATIYLANGSVFGTRRIAAKR